VQIQVCEGEADDEAMRVLGNTAVTNFHETEDTLDHVEGMLDPGTHACLSAVRLLLMFSEAFSACRAGVREICRRRSAPPDHGGLTAISRIAPDARFIAV
jgi:hypothetical protein